MAKRRSHKKSQSVSEKHVKWAEGRVDVSHLKQPLKVPAGVVADATIHLKAANDAYELGDLATDKRELRKTARLVEQLDRPAPTAKLVSFDQPHYADALTARAHALASMQYSSVRQELEQALMKFGGMDELQAEVATAFTQEAVQEAQVYYLSEPIVRLLDAPARTWNGVWTTARQNYPSPSGFVYLQRPIKGTAIEPATGNQVDEAWVRAISWGMFEIDSPDPEEERGPLSGIVTSYWAGPEPPALWMPTTTMTRLDRTFEPAHVHDISDSMRYLGGLFVSFLTFVMQKIIEPETHVPDRATRRRLEREHPQEARRPQIQVIRLRKRAQERESLDEERKRIEWTCQWAVSGHWRIYTRGREKPLQVWVSPYVKGPPDKPFKTGTLGKVLAVIR